MVGAKILHATRCSPQKKPKNKSPKAGTVGSKYKREKADPKKGMQSIIKSLDKIPQDI